MKQFGIVTLVSVAVSAAAPGPRANAATFATHKSVEQFGGCFVGKQDAAALPWSFVPKSDGGTFSNAGARGARGIYFLAIADRGPVRRLHLESAEASSGIDPQVVRAVEQCA